ncbi:unnamed protein product [Oncorhynchus mykiss]|uniref:Uncharacterized protein n=1 Tax=Oncorhynchus mykiss TaxID=8022 RepID=A0A060WPZ1_ONCMY|nr:unnamed protein product [Oncorhynchus mykiss]
MLCLPLWVVVLATVISSIGTCTLLYFYGFELQTNGTRSWVIVLESMAIATLGPPAVFALRTILQTSKHLLYTMGSSIQHQMNSSAISDQMGFMNKVRKEVGFMVEITHFIGGVRGEEDPCGAGDHPPGPLRPRHGGQHLGGGECPVCVHPSCGPRSGGGLCGEHHVDLWADIQRVRLCKQDGHPALLSA